jgi:predicted AlkP superfamily pyrophosphatase or phosphodiesterase
VELLTEDNPTAMFVYFGQVDETGHKRGFHPSVAQYIEAIRRVDGHIGRVLAALQSRKSYDQEDWLILVSSDHGGKGTEHGGGHREPEILNSFLIVHGNAAKPGKIEQQTYLVDVPVTALTHSGVRIDPAWNLDGKPVALR